MKPSEIAFGVMRIPIDLMMVILSFFIAYKVRTLNIIPGIELPLDLSSFPSLGEYLHFSLLAGAIFVAICALKKMYNFKATSKGLNEIKQVISASTTWMLVLVLYFFLIRSFPFSRLALIYTWLFTMALISCGRILIRTIEHFVQKSGIGRNRILFIGNNKLTAQLAFGLKKDISYQILGYLDEADQTQENHAIPYLGKPENLEQIVKNHRIETIIQTKTGLNQIAMETILNFCRENHIGFSFVPNILEVQHSNVETTTLEGIPVLTIKPTPLDGWGSIAKRIFDLTGSTIGLIILSPLLLITAIAIKLDSKGTILFKYLDDGSRAKRIGQRGKPFNFYKFRTMYPNTHSLRYTELADHNLRKGSPLIKIENDPRITRVGKFLRKTSIDELPQLWNVLIGNMSLVGPRPHLPEEVAHYQKHHKFVLTIKPGITGLAQISGRSNLDFEQEIKLDTYYIEHWSLPLDLIILFKTLGVLFKGYEE